jgi:methylmalonyl-CoA/ethylmalonyl-CoA epimerase
VQLVQVAQSVQDLERAVTFYRDVLGLRYVATFDPPGLAFFDLDGVRLLLERGATSSLLYLRVDDVHGRVQHLAGLGVTVETEPFVVFTHEDDSLGPAGAQEWMAFVRDSEGNLVGLVEQRAAGGAAPAS